MKVESRRIRSLRLKSPSHAAAGGAQALLAEALRLASLPGEGLPGRLLVRNLDLRLFEKGLKAPALAKRISSALSGAAGNVFAFTSPGAEQAQAIRLRSEEEPWMELLRRASRPASYDVRAWFWPILIPELQQSLRPATAARLAVDHLVASSHGARALASVLTELVREHSEAQLVQSLTRTHGQRLLALHGLVLLQKPARDRSPADRSRHLDASGTRIETPRVQASVATLDPRWQRVLADSVATWGAEDPRTLWLCFSAWCAFLPARASSPTRATQVLEIARGFRRQMLASEREGPGVDKRVTALETHVEALEVDAAALETPHGQAQPQAPLSVRTQQLRRVTKQEQQTPAFKLPQQPVPELAQAEAADAAMVDDAFYSPLFSLVPQRTQYAGLYFLLPVLKFLGIDQFLQVHPHLLDADLMRRILARVADRLKIPPQDPIRGPLSFQEAKLANVSFEEPEAWQNELPGWSEGECSLGSPTRETEAAHGCANLVRTWERATLAWLKGYTGFTYSELVCREGGALHSRTHLDLVFNLSQADVRLRRWALDLNPGYVPHLGLVVTFYYERSVTNL